MKNLNSSRDIDSRPHESLAFVRTSAAHGQGDLDQESESSSIRRNAARLSELLDSKPPRGFEAINAAPTASHLDVVYKGLRDAQQEARRAQAKLSLYQAHLQYTQIELERVLGLLNDALEQKNHVEDRAARAKSMAKKVVLERRVNSALEEGKNLGFEAGFRRAQEQLGSCYCRHRTAWDAGDVSIDPRPPASASSNRVKPTQSQAPSPTSTVHPSSTPHLPRSPIRPLVVGHPTRDNVNQGPYHPVAVSNIALQHSSSARAPPSPSNSPASPMRLHSRSWSDPGTETTSYSHSTTTSIASARRPKGKARESWYSQGQLGSTGDCDTGVLYGPAESWYKSRKPSPTAITKTNFRRRVMSLPSNLKFYTKHPDPMSSSPCFRIDPFPLPSPNPPTPPRRRTNGRTSKLKRKMRVLSVINESPLSREGSLEESFEKSGSVDLEGTDDIPPALPPKD